MQKFTLRKKYLLPYRMGTIYLSPCRAIKCQVKFPLPSKQTVGTGKVLKVSLALTLQNTHPSLKNVSHIYLNANFCMKQLNKTSNLYLRLNFLAKVTFKCPIVFSTTEYGKILLTGFSEICTLVFHIPVCI